MTWIKPDLALTGTSLQMTPEPAGAAYSMARIFSLIFPKAIRNS